MRRWRCKLFGHLFRDITEESPPELVDPPTRHGRRPRSTFHLRPSLLWQWADDPKLVECVRCGVRARILNRHIYVENAAGEFDCLVLGQEITVLGVNTRRIRREQRHAAQHERHLILSERVRAARKQKGKDSADGMA